MAKVHVYLVKVGSKYLANTYDPKFTSDKNKAFMTGDRYQAKVYAEKYPGGEVVAAIVELD